MTREATYAYPRPRSRALVASRALENIRRAFASGLPGRPRGLRRGASPEAAPRERAAQAAARRARGGRAGGRRRHRGGGCAASPARPGSRRKLRHAARDPRAAGLSPRLLARRQRGHQLPPLLRRQRPRRAAHGRPGGLRRSRASPAARADRRRARVDGLRLDPHVDGLYDPAGDLERLHERLRCAPSPRRAAGASYLVVEKITASYESTCRSGRCTARPATTSPTSSTGCSWIPPRARAWTAPTGRRCPRRATGRPSPTRASNWCCAAACFVPGAERRHHDPAGAHRACRPLQYRATLNFSSLRNALAEVIASLSRVPHLHPRFGGSPRMNSGATSNWAIPPPRAGDARLPRHRYLISCKARRRWADAADDERGAAAARASPS